MSEGSPSKIRIAHCIHGLGIGGAQKILKSIVRLANPDRFDFLVYCCRDGVLRSEVEKAGAKVEVIPRLIPKFDPLWALRLARRFRGDNVQMVHTHLFGDSLHGYLAAWAANQLPVIMTLHTLFPALPSLQRLGYRFLLKRCNRTVACSKEVLVSLAEIFPSRSGEILLIRNGVDTSLLDRTLEVNPEEQKRKLGVPANETIICSIGRLSAEKGQRTIISAYSHLPPSIRSRSRLIFLGDGPLRHALTRQAASEGVSDRVLFAGNRSDVEELLVAVDVLVIASKIEGLSIALLEAMAASRCIIATDIPGIREAIRHDCEALLYPPGSIPDLSGTLQGILSDPVKRERLGERARHRCKKYFSGERMVREYVELYENLCSR